MADPDMDIPADEWGNWPWHQLLAQFALLLRQTPVEMWRQLFAQFLLLGCLSLLAGAAAMLLLGLMVYCRLRSGQSLKDCITEKTCVLAGASLAASLLLLLTVEIPWDCVRTLVLMVLTAPALLTWLGPPDEHVEAFEVGQANVGQIGQFGAYSHYHGYLRLMHGDHEAQRRLKKFRRDNMRLLPEDASRCFASRCFHSDCVAVLLPTDGQYPTSWTDLRGIGKRVAEVPAFQCNVAGNKRTYATFPVHEVTSSDGKDKVYVALDKVGALQTLQKLREEAAEAAEAPDFTSLHFTDADFQKQMTEMIDELENIINKKEDLRFQLFVVRYRSDDHVGDLILHELDSIK